MSHITDEGVKDLPNKSSEEKEINWLINKDKEGNNN